MSNPLNFGAKGDGKTDDTQAIQHAIKDGDGILELPRGVYRVTKTIVIDLAKTGRQGVTGNGGTATIRMDGKGPAIFLKGTHGGTADPASFQPAVWQKERMPQVSGIEIIGGSAEADGIRIEGAMQTTLNGVLLRNLRHAVHVTKRTRNLLVTGCHIYFCKGAGVWIDEANVHQAIITGSHISYCRLGGVRIDGGEIRNLQITGNDIEYNNNRAHKVEAADDVATAEVFINTRDGSVREGTISGNTLQATYSPNGANIRIIGRGKEANHKAGMWAISGNLIGSQAVNVHLTSARGVTVSGNYIYSGHRRNLLAEDSRNLVIGSNCFGHNPDYGPKELCTGLRFVGCEDVSLSGSVIQDCRAGKHTVKGAPELKRNALVEFEKCRRSNLSGLQIIDAAPYGLELADCRDTLITGCTVLDSREKPLMKAAVRCTGKGTGNVIAHSRLGKGREGAITGDGALRSESIY